MPLTPHLGHCRSRCFLPAFCTVVNVILCKGLPRLSQAAISLLATPCSLPICLNVCSRKEIKRSRNPNRITIQALQTGATEEEGGGGSGGEIALIHPFYKTEKQMESGSLCHNDEQYTKHMYSNYYKTCICSASQNIGTLLILAS